MEGSEAGKGLGAFVLVVAVDADVLVQVVASREPFGASLEGAQEGWLLCMVVIEKKKLDR